MTYPEITDQTKRDKAAEQLWLWREMIECQRSDPVPDIFNEIRINNNIIAIRAYRYALMLLGKPPAPASGA